jgi:hypothetical protein
MSKLAKALTAAAGNAGGDNLYVEDVFSTYLYTGADANETITNGIDLSGEGGFVWIKPRTTTGSHLLFDTERGTGKYLVSSSTAAEATYNPYLSSFNSDGFTTFAFAPADYASWTFRKAEKFFDVVTYTGTGSARTVAHNLGSVPAVMIIKRTSTSGSNWRVYHSSLGNGQALSLNATDAAGATTSLWNSTTPTDSVFTLGDNGNVNLSGGTFVAYLFASDAGGFGDDGDESIIKCGSFTTGGQGKISSPVDCGFEPQWLLVKNSGASENWNLYDVMRGLTVAADAILNPNLSNAEDIGTKLTVTATGFDTPLVNGPFASGATYIYIAIRRPMKTPESGTEVFTPIASTSTIPTTSFAVGFPADFLLQGFRTFGISARTNTRLTGGSAYLETANTTSEASGFGGEWDLQDDYAQASGVSTGLISYMFKRATGFFDVVAYTGTGSATTQAHNLAVVPEMIIVKRRSSTEDWLVYHSATGNQAGTGLNETNATYTGVSQYWNSTSPTDTVFSLGTHGRTNTSAETYIAYLFATLAGVSKVGSYTGTAADLNVDCGFSAGARFILIKRTDSTGDWYVYDSVRGIVAGNDPYLLLNSTAAEVTSTDYIDPLSSGFTVTSSAPAALNASGGTYIFLAIA